jgi:hypothetical protein
MNKSILHAILATIALVLLLFVLLAWMAPPAIADRIDCWTSITGHTYCRTLDWSA